VMIVQRRELKDQQKSRSLATIDTNNPYRIKPQLRRGRGPHIGNSARGLSGKPSGGWLP
jgi:hypothetical protein